MSDVGGNRIDGLVTMGGGRHDTDVSGKWIDELVNDDNGLMMRVDGWVDG